MAANKIVGVGLLTERDLELLGPGFDRFFPIGETSDFDDLLKAIDEADRKLNDKPR